MLAPVLLCLPPEAEFLSSSRLCDLQGCMSLVGADLGLVAFGISQLHPLPQHLSLPLPSLPK